MLYHSGARNYSCELCGNKFFQMEHLKRHMHSIHYIAAPTVSPDSNAKRAVKKQLKAAAFNPANKPKQRNLTLSKKVPLNEQTKQSQQFFKITSRCMYKCQQCDFSTVKLYNLNEHAIKSHARPSIPTDADHFDLDQIEDEEENVSDIIEDDDDESSDDEEEHQKHNEYVCSFCAFKSNKKISLKRHLNGRHSSQVTAPILLQNDPIILNGNTRFQCSVCRFLLTSLNEYTKHMSEKHSVQVFVVDSNEPTSTQVSFELTIFEQKHFFY